MNTVIGLGDALNAETARTLSQDAYIGGAFAKHSHTIGARAANTKERLAYPNDTSP